MTIDAKRLIRSLDDYFKVAIVVIVFLSFLLRAQTPANILLGTSYDDWLGIQLANNLQNGEWLGAWDIRTLMKGAGYSIFVAPLKSLGISPLVATHGLYLYGSWLVVSGLGKYLTKHVESRIFAIAGFAFAAFNPIVYSSDFSRLHRISLFGALILISTGHIIYIVNSYKGNRNSKYPFYLHLFGLGFTLGFCAITRSESKLAIVVIIVGLMFHLILFRIKHAKVATSVYRLRVIAGIGAFLIFFSFAPTLLVGHLNMRYYQSPVTDNYLDGSFADAFNSLSSIEPRNEERMFVPLSKTQLNIAYSVSPSFKSLENYLTSFDSWEKQTSCQQGVACDSSSSWIAFELRDAAQATNNFGNEREFQLFFKKVFDEIDSACSKRLISCGIKGIATGVPPVNSWNWGEVFQLSTKSFQVIMNFDYPINKQPQTMELIESIYPEWISTIEGPDKVELLGGTSSRIANFLQILQDVYAVLSWSILGASLLLFPRIIMRYLRSDNAESTATGAILSITAILFLMNVVTSIIANSSFGLGVVTIYLIPGAVCLMAFSLMIFQILIREIAPQNHNKIKKGKK
jgi:hypothetical protein